jgi:hypothetical protein
MDNDTKISGNLKAYHDFIFDTNNHYSTTPNGYQDKYRQNKCQKEWGGNNIRKAQKGHRCSSFIHREVQI